MNDALDPLEQELMNLRPREISPDLRRRVEESMARMSSQKKPHSLVGLLVVAGLAAACGWLIWRWVAPTTTSTSPTTSQIAGQVTPVETPPSLIAYRRALDHSPEDFDVLVRKHARVPVENEIKIVPLYALSNSDAAFHAFLGD